MDKLHMMEEINMKAILKKASMRVGESLNAIMTILKVILKIIYIMDKEYIIGLIWVKNMKETMKKV